MVQVLEREVAGGVGVRRLAVVGLLAVGGALAPLVARRREVVARRPEGIEVARLEVGGAHYGAVYEDGRLLGVLEGVDRL